MMNAAEILADRSARTARRALILLASTALCGCGFQLAGSGDLPNVMATTYVQTTTPNSDFYDSLRDTLRSRGLDLVGTPDVAAARLIITEDITGQRVLSVSARNTPREYEIFYAVTFALQAGAQNLIEPEQLVVTRSYTYDETQVLGKAREERVLRRSLADDLARRVVRRIEALAAPAAPGVSPAG